MTSSRKLEAQKDGGYLSEVAQVLRLGGFRYQLSVKVVNAKYKEGGDNTNLLTYFMVLC